jgi:branched-chain amino acid transport system permease protein
VYSVVQEEMVVNFPQFHLLLYGALLILIVLFEPAGLVGLWRRLARRLPGWPTANRGARAAVSTAAEDTQLAEKHTKGSA